MVDGWCSESIKERKRYLRKVRKNCSIEDLFPYNKKKAQAVVRRVIRAAKRTYWRESCGTIGKSINISEI